MTALTAIGVILVILTGPLLSIESVENKTICVTEKERVTSRNDAKYLVFTNNEVFENTDTIMFWKWNSSDVYGKLKPGKCYEAKVNWFRVPFLSMYRNIIPRWHKESINVHHYQIKVNSLVNHEAMQLH